MTVPRSTEAGTPSGHAVLGNGESELSHGWDSGLAAWVRDLLTLLVIAKTCQAVSGPTA